jgi:hypothetical protein
MYENIILVVGSIIISLWFILIVWIPAVVTDEIPKNKITIGNT